MLNRRRLIHSKLLVNDAAGSKKKQMLVALSGIPSPGDSSFQAISAQVQVYKENYDPSAKKRKSFRSPKITIPLESAEISVVGNPPQGNGRRGSKKSRSSIGYPFCVITNEGVCYEFVADNESERLVWVTVLEFLVLFPFSVVPDVPKCNPVFRSDLDPNLYHADSVWSVYILPEEVGSRCSIIGSNVLALQGRISGSRTGKLEIYDMTDSCNPVVSWDHNKIRRTGKLGRLLFIEIGRRCTGGPGLLWMYIGNDDKQIFEFRNILRRFLFEEVKRDSQETPSPPETPPTPMTPTGSPDDHTEVPPPLPPMRKTASYPTTPYPQTPTIPEHDDKHHHYNILEASS